jgi:hypothetical protein
MKNIEIPKEQLIILAKRHELKELALFGSVLSEEFSKESDIDVLIEFLPDVKASLFDLVEIKDELESIFMRKVDVVEKTGLRNPFRRKSILENLEILYAA